VSSDVLNPGRCEKVLALNNRYKKQRVKTYLFATPHREPVGSHLYPAISPDRQVFRQFFSSQLTKWLMKHFKL